jgi:hypothetical protein
MQKLSPALRSGFCCDDFTGQNFVFRKAAFGIPSVGAEILSTNRNLITETSNEAWMATAT